MAKVRGTFHEMDIPDEREIVHTDGLRFPWKEDRAGYFLIKIEKGEIHCGFLAGHTMKAEFVGKDPFNIIKEIAKRKMVNPEHMGYVAAELMRAKMCMESKEGFVQR